MRSFIRVNHKIRVPQVRCIRPDGTMAGVMPTRDALKLAIDLGQDLVEVSPNADPPVCRIMDFGKFKYEESRKQREARKNQHSVVIKEMKFHANVGEHDYNTKLGHIRDFLEKGHKVKLSLTFRGRENVHRELGFDVVKRIIADIAETGAPESATRMFGNSIVVMLSPKAAKS